MTKRLCGFSLSILFYNIRFVQVIQLLLNKDSPKLSDLIFTPIILLHYGVLEHDRALVTFQRHKIPVLSECTDLLNDSYRTCFSLVFCSFKLKMYVLLFLCVWVIFLLICPCTTYVPGIHGVQKRALLPLRLELQKVFVCHVGGKLHSRMVAMIP